MKRPLEDYVPTPSAPTPVPSNGHKTDPRIKQLIDYYYQAFTKCNGYAPTVYGGTWGKVFKVLLRENTQATIEAVIDEFFGYEKRTRHGIHDFERNFDNVYGRLHRLQYEGVQHGA